MSEILALANRILQERGYLVLAGNAKLRRGEVVPRFTSLNGELHEAPLVVIAETNVQDFIEQRILAGIQRREKPARQPGWSFYYRVICE